TVYGPGQRPDMAFHRFLAAALRDQAVEVFGDGEQTRDVTFVDDAVRATMAAAAADATGAINVGGGSQVAVNEVLKVIGRLTDTSVKVERLDAAPGDVRHTSADIGRARALLGYEPAVGIEEGLARELEWLRDRL